jgi:ABC-type Fe3+ transport system substrate-binding protein
MKQRLGQARTTARRASRLSRSPALAGLAVAAAAALTAAGCSSSSAGSSQASATGSSQAAASGSSLSQLAAENLSVSQLAAGAKQEGNLSLYYTDTGTPAIIKAFEKAYPFIHVTTYMAQGATLLTHLKADYQSGSGFPDAIVESDIEQGLAQEAGYLEPFKVPSTASYSGIYVKQASGGLDEFVSQENSPLGFSWNTKLLPASEVPTSLSGLLAANLKGKLAISGHSTGIDWIGEVLKGSGGSDFMSKFSQNGVHVEDVSGAALSGLVATGAVIASPTIGVTDVIQQAAKGAPVGFRFLTGDPSDATINGIGVGSKAPDPYAALLYTNFALSMAGQSTVSTVGWFSALKGAPEPDTASAGIANWPQTLAAADLVDPGHLWTPDQYETQYTQWQQMINNFGK